MSDYDAYAELSKRYDDLRARVAELEITEAFYKLAIKERDYERVRADRIERELERWRHDVTIEGDYVCPDSLRMTAPESALREMIRYYVLPGAESEKVEKALQDLLAAHATHNGQEVECKCCSLLISDCVCTDECAPFHRLYRKERK